MSRIGKQVIELPEKTTCTMVGDLVTVTGPLGTLTRRIDPRFAITVADNELTIKPGKLTLETNMLWGTYASHLANMVEGVSRGFKKELTVEGVGYKYSLAGDKLAMAVGLSHPVELKLPEGIKVVIEKANLTVSGIDKEVVGHFAAEIRAQRPPEPYKGKGIRYVGEQIRRKAGKKVTA